jgi:hypothetical protein
MPYISPDRRTIFDSHVKDLIAILKDGCPDANVGDLNYIITTLCNGFFRQCTTKGYKGNQDIIGVLECAKLEFYRRATAPYEDDKITQNGDVNYGE